MTSLSLLAGRTVHVAIQRMWMSIVRVSLRCTCAGMYVCVYGCTGSSEPSLVVCVINTLFLKSWSQLILSISLTLSLLNATVVELTRLQSKFKGRVDSCLF